MKRLFFFFAAVVMAVSVTAQNEIGIIAGGINGLSYKHWFSETGAIQTDLAVGLTAAPMVIYVNGSRFMSSTNSQYDFTINPNVLAHHSIIPAFQVYAGAGVNLGILSDLSNTNPSNIIGKAGVNVVVGWAVDFSPVVLSLDFRPGYGLGFQGNLIAHFFDWKLGFAVRYSI